MKSTEDKCEESLDGSHEPDWGSVSVSYDGETYIDINCRLCGRSGCVGSQSTLADGIDW